MIVLTACVYVTSRCYQLTLSANGLLRALSDYMNIAISLLIAIIGILMYALCVNPKLQEIGRISFAMGILAFLLRVGPDMLAIFQPR